MKTRTINVYQYSELSDEAKEKARQWWLECNQDLQFEWECIQDDAKQVGIELTEYDYRRYCKGELKLDFTQVLANIIQQHGESCETHKTAKEYQDKYLLLNESQEEEKEELEKEFTQAILEDYRILIDKDIEYRETEEYISEIMEINEYEFDENGNSI